MVQLAQLEYGAELMILNSIGQTVHRSSHAVLEKIDMPFLQRGVFIVQVRLANGKILKQKFVN